MLLQVARHPLQDAMYVSPALLLAQVEYSLIQMNLLVSK